MGLNVCGSFILHYWWCSLVRGLLPLEKTPGIISFLAGKPNPIMFPLTSLSFSARSPHSSSATDETIHTLSPDELSLGLQYSDTAGIKTLRDWLYGLQDFSHGRRRGEGWSVCVGSGSQDLIYKVGSLCWLTDPFHWGWYPCSLYRLSSIVVTQCLSNLQFMRMSLLKVPYIIL